MKSNDGVAPRAHPVVDLRDYTRGIRERWPEGDIYRVMIHDLPRSFHALRPHEQKTVLETPPDVTGTPWDALLAAIAEHVARLHGHASPAWTEEPARFLDVPWIVTPVRENRIRDAIFAPPAFIRHGAIPDPRDLDARGGERHAWLPDPR